MDDWQRNLLTDDARIAELVRSANRIAVLGVKTEAQADQPAFYVARYLADHGAEVVPVPVFYPEVTQILGRPVFRKVADVPGPIDIVDVFRKPADVIGHLDDIIDKRPRAQDGAADPAAIAPAPATSRRDRSSDTSAWAAPGANRARPAAVASLAGFST